MKKMSKLLALLLAGAISASMIQTAAFSVAAVSNLPSQQQSSAVTGSGWSINSTEQSNVLPEDVQTAFDQAMASYNGTQLEPLAFLGIQLVAGYNYRILCREKNSGNWDNLKDVTIYAPFDGDAGVTSLDNFSIDDYLTNYDIKLPDELPCGSMEIARPVNYGNMPDDAKTVFNDKFGTISGVSYHPVAFLGSKDNGSGGKLYSYICLISPAVPDPDITLSVFTISADSNLGNTQIYSSYDLLGERTVYPGRTPRIEYEFYYQGIENPGYADGVITFTAKDSGKYKLFWAQGRSILANYYPISEFDLNASESKSITLESHVAIPAAADSIVAVKIDGSNEEIVAEYYLPQFRQTSYGSGKLLYTFSAYSDVHIDKGSLWYVNAESNLKKALGYSCDMGADYIIISGDVVTNDSGPDKEWDAYQKVLSNSDYVNPVWESDGNHDMRQDVESGLKSFVKGSGTDGSKSGKPYFYMVEKKTGDIFIFMALELNKDPHNYEEFTDEQLNWVKSLINQYYSSRNIFIIQHSPIKGFGAGDRMSNPYYNGLLNQKHSSTMKFKEILETYPNVMFLSGHTHEDFVMNYNYSNENGTAANMIHTPSLAGSTMPNSSDDGLERNGGKGFNSQAYHVEVYENSIIFYGVNITDKKIYPLYSYIMNGSRTSESPVIDTTEKITMTNETADASQELAKVSYVLSKYYAYASYDSYQSLKKLYYEYKDQTVADKAVIAEFEKRIEALSVYTGNITYHALNGTYYFVNTEKWSSVYAYAWSGSSKNAEWPGVKLSKFSTNSYGQDIYKVEFKSADEFKNIIFNGGSNANQTVDIALESYEGNAFYINGSENGKYKVKNFSYNTGENDEQIALLYYVTDEHGWDNTDTYFKSSSDGTYKTEYKSNSEKNISFCLKSESKYLCVPESQKLDFENGAEFEYTLTESSSRGKSITVSGLNENSKIEIVYYPSTKKVKVICTDTSVVQPKELVNKAVIGSVKVPQNTSVFVTGDAEGGDGNYKYAFYYKKSTSGAWQTIGELYGNTKQVSFVPATVAKYLVKVNVKDGTGKIVTKQFTVESTKPQGNDLINTSVTDRTTVARNTTVKITGSAENGAGGYKYAFYYKKAASKAFIAIGEEYGSASTAEFTPAMTADYNVRINVKDSAGTIVTKQYKITVVSASTLLNESYVSATKVKKGTTVKITANASGATAPYKYSFYYKKSTSSSWTQIKTSSEYAEFTPAVKATYQVKAVVEDSSGKTATKTFTITSE